MDALIFAARMDDARTVAGLVAAVGPDAAQSGLTALLRLLDAAEATATGPVPFAEVCNP